MKQILTFLLVLFSISLTTAQILEPVEWSTSIEKKSETEIDLIATASIDSGWHLYSQDVPDDGPVPTSFSFEESNTYELVGKTKEEEGHTVDDPVFGMKIKFFEDKAEFRQTIKLLGNPGSIKASVNFMVCDDTRCLPPNDVDFEFEIPKKKSSILEPVSWSSEVKKLSETEYELTYVATIDGHWHFYSQNGTKDEGPIETEFTFDTDSKDFELIGETTESETVEVFEKVFQMKVRYFEDKAVFKQKIKLLNPEAKSIASEVYYQVCDNEKCLQPMTEVFNTSLTGKAEVKNEVVSIDANSKAKSDALNLNVTGWEKYEKEEVKEKTNFGIFILGFLGGLVALLTPCVFPMIPLTVTFFTKSASNSQKGLANAMLYGFFILLIYVLLSLPFHFLDSLNPEILNTISTNVWLNLFFFAILIFFAISFLGYFEITLPSSWGNKMDSASSSIGGFIGVFFMALTLAIVSFSCTGPILGSLLAGSLTSDGGAMQLTMGMSGFGLALALPFTLFAMFPKWLNSLPKSGGWLNTVKVVLAHAEFALALKFLSNADLVKHWGLLKREVFIGLWIIIGISLLLYLLGKIKFPHDGPFKKISMSKWAFIFLVFAFVIYLIPGLTNTKYANLTLLSGFPPPLPYSLYEKDSECPLGLNCYKDLDEGIAAAKEQNKPIMLDFTGWACVNCRKMEEQVWSQDKIYKILKEDYVIISLYVDDRKPLADEEQFQYIKQNGRLKDIKTIGDKWATLQTLNFQNNSQPFYVLLDHNMELLNYTTAYTPNADEYYDWLKVGVENFKR